MLTFPGFITGNSPKGNGCFFSSSVFPSLFYLDETNTYLSFSLNIILVELYGILA